MTETYEQKFADNLTSWNAVAKMHTQGTAVDVLYTARVKGVNLAVTSSAIHGGGPQ
jgi:hypothetical protein